MDNKSVAMKRDEVVWQLGRVLGLLVLSVIGAAGQVEKADDFRLFPPSLCHSAQLPPRMAEWQEDLEEAAVTVEWTYGDVSYT